MVEDNDKNLWLTTPSGIYRINNNRNEVSKFSKEFGINPQSLNGVSPYKANDGQLFFGTVNGYYSFYPDKISSNEKPPEIVLTDLRIADRSVKPGSGSALKEDLLQAKQIELSHDQNVFLSYLMLSTTAIPMQTKPCTCSKIMIRAGALQVQSILRITTTFRPVIILFA